MDHYLKLIQGALITDISPCQNPSDPKEWARLGFHIAYHLNQMVQDWRFKTDQLKTVYKPDGSPATEVEVSMEAFARKVLHRFYPEAVFCGEESGGDSEEGAYLFVIDPIDGTRSFLSGFGTYSITLAILQAKSPQFSLVCTPSTGEVYFRIGEEDSMVFQIPRDDQEIELHDIPLPSRPNKNSILVNLHPSKQALPYLERLFALWQQGEISLLRAVSGSPSLLIVEAAKTGTYYINTWSSAPTKPYDLIPALHIIGASDCQAIGRDGLPINAWNHQGFYLVGPMGKERDLLLSKMPSF